VWVFQTGGFLSTQADWLARHGTGLHTALVAAIGIAIFVGVGVLLQRRLSRISLAVGLTSLIVAGAVFVGEAAASASNVRDIERRVRQVATAVRPTPRKLSVRSYANHWEETYSVDANVGDVERTILATFDRPGATGLDNGHVYGSGTYLTISFRGRGGCDGTVDLSITSSPSVGATTVEIAARCED
jgi:hypothetical protein